MSAPTPTDEQTDDVTVAFTSNGKGGFELSVRGLGPENRVRDAVGAEGLERARRQVDDLYRGQWGRATEPGLELATDVGARLRLELLDDAARSLLDAAVERRSRPGRSLRLIIVSPDSVELLDLPWELMVVARRSVTSDGAVNVVRYLANRSSRPFARSPVEQLRVLAVLASPTDLPQLDADRIRADIERATSSPVRARSMALEWLASPTAARLSAAVAGASPHVVHYVGFVESAYDGSKRIALDDETGRAAWLDESRIGRVLAGADPPALFVLHGSGREGGSGTSGRFASDLARLGVPAVLTTNGLSDSAAVAFNAVLYESLVSGWRVDVAVADARRQVQVGLGMGDWFLPALYVTDLDLRLVAPRRAERPTVSAPRPHVGEEDGGARRERLIRRGALAEVAGGIPFNRAVGGGALVVPSSGPLPVLTLPNDVAVTLLSPDLAALRRVADAWRKDFAEAGFPAPDLAGTSRGVAPATDAPAPATGSATDAPATGSAPTALGDAEADAGKLRPVRRRVFGSDTAAANNSSLAFLVEHAGSSCLITGDAPAERLERSLGRLVAERRVARLPVDVTVLPHGGSARNVTPTLLDLLDCERFVISTDGRHFGHPDPETVELLGSGRAAPVTVYFNYRSPATERYADPEVQRRLNIVAVYPDGGVLSVAVDRAATSADGTVGAE